MGVLCDIDLEFWAKRGLVYPYHPEQLQPASYDLCLGRTLRVFDTSDDSPQVVDPEDKECLARLTRGVGLVPRGEFVLNPWQFVLGSTEEKVHIPLHMVGRLEGKSTIGRIGMAIHITAGYLDPDFRGVITLEILNVSPKPIILRRGMFIAQLGLIMLTRTPRKGYSGRYQGDSEATPAKPQVRPTAG